MERDRLTFLYGDDVIDHDWDFDDLELRSQLLERSFTVEFSAANFLGREIVANQIVADEPAEVWSTAKRLLALGCDRERVFQEITMAFAPVMKAALERAERFDAAAYALALARLPLPTVDEVERAMIDVVRAAQGIDADELATATLERLARDSGDEVVGRIVDHVMDRLVDEFAPLAWVACDRTVHVGDLTAGIVMTHRLTESECETGVLDASFDLAGFHRLDDLTLPSGEPIHVGWHPPHRLGWTGPDGWLDPYAAGAILAVEVTADSVVHIAELATDPTADAELVKRLRAAYDLAVDEPWLPVSGEDLVLALLLDEPGSFRDPHLPLTDLSEAAGLERRLDEVAHDETVWHNEVRSRRTWRVMDAMGHDSSKALKVLHALDIADLLSGTDMSAVPEINRPADTATLRELLADLRDEPVLVSLGDELFDNDEPDARARGATFTEALLAAATRPRDRAVARWLTALHAERCLEPRVAEQHLHLAHEADAGFGPVIDRLAWYASDRGDATRAARLWRGLEPSSAISQDLREVEQFTSSRRPSLGRNDPCWCGSGRKYKQCHLGSIELPALPDRVGWLCRKAVAFIERRGHAARADVLNIAHARAVDPHDHDSVVAAFDDPIVMDIALTEGGWFKQFLDERGELLPDDEALLARSWELVDRTVYEVVDVRPGVGLDLLDHRTGDRLAVREVTFSRETRTGALVCGRAVPDGETHQLIGAVFPVPPGREGHLLDLLDDGDPETIADWVAGLYRPPVLKTREGEALVQCDLVIDVGTTDAVRAFLDANYDAHDSPDHEAWVEMFPINDDEQILRATLTLDGSRLSVSTTSEQRAERVLSAILASFPDASVLTDRRTPADIKAMMRRQELEARLFPGGAPDRATALDDPDVAAQFAEVRDRFEQRWCDESIPALGGLTPRQAAHDPTRRDELARLITSFEGPVPDNAVTMRPERLRELLDLDL